MDSRFRGNDEVGVRGTAHPSKSKTRSVAAIGYGCVIPAKAGIHFAAVKRLMDSRLRGNDGKGGNNGKGSAMTHPSKSKTRSVAAIGNGCVIPAKAGIHFAILSRLTQA